MEKLYNINKWAIIITILLYFTFWGGILAQTILGGIQILMSIYIIFQHHQLVKSTKLLFISYIILTITVCFLFKFMGENNIDEIKLLFSWIIVTMLLAFFHLYITYKIHKS